MAIAPLAAASLRVGPHGLAVSEQLVLASLRAWARARMAGDDPQRAAEQLGVGSTKTKEAKIIPIGE